jgi:hypothetical protein
MRSGKPGIPARVALGLGLIFGLLEPATAPAQGVPTPGGRAGRGALNSIRRPTVSPYLNLMNSNSTELDYYNFVRPQQQFRGAANQLYREVGNLESGLQRVRTPTEQKPGEAAPLSTGRMTPTGHPVTFGNLSGYFLGSSGGMANRTGFGGNRR